MPRRQYMVDLQTAQSGLKPTGVTSIKPGGDDGQFVFEYAAPALDGAPQMPVSITAMIPDLSEYPKDHAYMIYCDDDAPKHIGEALQTVRGTDRKTVFELVDIVSTTLSALAPDSDGDTAMHDSQYDEEQYDEDFDQDDVYADDDESFSFGAPVVTPSTAPIGASSHTSLGTRADKPFRDRIRADLRAAKEAGFKVGYLGHLFDGYNAFVTVSIRMSKLGISEEAMQAWQVEPNDYLVLIIQYPNGYKTNEQFQAFDSIRLKPNIGMRVYASKYYKPTLQEAIKAFTKSHRDQAPSGAAKDRESIGETGSIRDTFISKPLAALLEENLVSILRYRSTGMDWHGAESWYSDSQGAGSTGDPNYIPDRYYQPETIHRAFPDIVLGDQYGQRNASKFSFPLLAMQFLLRHFVRCTEFCLVCHRKMDSELEAIKPYVCERPLCLFQYMAMGFGPSIEHEILAQPYVVDLLVSFCYSSAAAKKLKEHPDGLALMVPPLSPSEDIYQPLDRYGQPVAATATPMTTPTAESSKYEIGFDRERRELIFFKKPSGGCPVSRGAWIVVKTTAAALDGSFEELHCRVAETTFFPTITIDEPVVVKIGGEAPLTAQGRLSSTVKQPATPAPTPKWVDAHFTIYNQDFEQLDSATKCTAVCKLLNTLPSVKEMQEYLLTNRHVELKNWVERMSPAAVSLLRWIIASNRACIMQVDGNEAGEAQSGVGKKQERLYGMKDYMQFRFAMGAPDKEQRFLTEVRTTRDRLTLQYPTLFAWHGSPLHNWHMIIREGLHFKNTDHGRAYGHGVYHATDAQTSTGYSGMYNYSGGRGGAAGPTNWPNSILRVTTALALNEIVNAPKEFVSSTPYYVVSQLDWIQTRYLFVQCSLSAESPVKIGAEEKPANIHPQDPARTPKGISDAVVIPASAIKSGRPGKEAGKRESSFLKSPVKKLKGILGDPIVIPDDDDAREGNESDETDVEDLEIMFDEPDAEPITAESTSQSLTINSKAKAKGIATDFEAGTLDFATLPMMPMPTYANSGTTKRLLNELKNLAREQDSEDPGKLGWYIDVDKIENVYQWIVELHSFHTVEVNGKPIPLAADMKRQGITSIVLEIRFGPDFPFSPPYIRVIRPRFLSLAHGGGGHIVMGGAMCMELLTNSGWSSVSTMSAVLMQVRLAIGSEPFARLDTHSRGDYGAGEAAEGYLRACRTHGWKEPPGFQQVAYGMRAEPADDEIL